MGKNGEWPLPRISIIKPGFLSAGTFRRISGSWRINPGGPFEFRAGQYATLGVEQDGNASKERTPSFRLLMKSPLSFFFEWFRTGISRQIFSSLNKRRHAALQKNRQGPFYSRFCAVEETNHLLVSTVTGIAPFVSYVRTLYRDWKKWG